MGHSLTYPDNPGHQDTDTSRQAAAEIKPKAEFIRERVLEALRGPLIAGATNHQIADHLKESDFNIQPRTSELRAKGLIFDSGKRGLTRHGKSCIIWTTIKPTGEAHGQKEATEATV